MKFAGWVLVNEEGKMFHITQYHQNLVWTDDIRNAIIFSTKDWAENSKKFYEKFLSNAKIMKLSYTLEEE